MANRARPDTLVRLASLREALVQAEREQQAAQRAAEQAQREANLFRDALGDVTPLASPARVQRQRALPAPVPTQRIQDEARVLTESMSDQFEIDSLLHVDANLSWSAPGLGADILRRLRGGHWRLQAELDLHGHRVDEAREELGQFLRDGARRGLRCVRVIHGKGLGSRGREPVLRDKVRRWLAQRNEVIAFCQARPADGGAGALVVLLRASNTRTDPA